MKRRLLLAMALAALLLPQVYTAGPQADANWGVPENLRAPEAAWLAAFLPVAARMAAPAR